MRVSQKLLFSILALFVVVCLYRLEEYMVADDFIIISTVLCNPAQESCFVPDCEYQGLGSDDCNQTPYKKITIHARNAPHCVYEHDCTYIDCTDSRECLETLCTTDSIEPGEMCIHTP